MTDTCLDFHHFLPKKDGQLIQKHYQKANQFCQFVFGGSFSRTAVCYQDQSYKHQVVLRVSHMISTKKHNLHLQKVSALRGFLDFIKLSYEKFALVGM